MAEISDACGAATGCGGCAPMVERLITLEAGRPDMARRSQCPAEHEAA